MNVRQIEELNKRVVGLFTEYGVEGNYLVSYILIDDEDGSVQAPTIGNVTELEDRGVSRPRAAAFMAEVILEALVDIVKKYCGLDIFSAAGALKGMLDQVRGTQVMKAQMDKMRQRQGHYPRTPVA